MPIPDVEVYDFCTRSWHNVDAGEFLYVLENRINYPATLKGIVHWIACNPYHVGGTFEKLIASFDLGIEKFGTLILPKSLPNEGLDHLSVSTLKDSLCLIHNKAGFTSIYAMKEYGIADSWEKLFNLDNCHRFACLRENGEILLVDKDHHLVSYDPKANKVMMDLGVHMGGMFAFTYAYVDNLFLIQGSNSRG